MAADRFEVKHRTYGYGLARGRVRDGAIECCFDTPQSYLFGGRWVPMLVEDLKRVRLEPMGVQHG